MAKKQDNIIKNALILFAITIIAGTLLGLTYEVTKEPIRIQQETVKKLALNSVIPEATNFLSIDIEDLESYSTIEAIYMAENDKKEIVGYAFEVIATKAYAGEIKLVVGIGMEGSILGIDILKQSETPGLGAKADEPLFKSEFVEEALVPLEVVKFSPSDEEGDISSISGATITSRSVTNSVNIVIDYCYKFIPEVKK